MDQILEIIETIWELVEAIGGIAKALLYVGAFAWFVWSGLRSKPEDIPFNEWLKILLRQE